MNSRSKQRLQGAAAHRGALPLVAGGKVFATLTLAMLLALTPVARASIDTRALGEPAEVPIGFTGDIPDNYIYPFWERI